MNIDLSADREEGKTTTPIPSVIPESTVPPPVSTIPHISPGLSSGTIISPTTMALVKNATAATKIKSSLRANSSPGSSNQTPPPTLPSQSNHSIQKSITSFFLSTVSPTNDVSNPAGDIKSSAQTTPEAAEVTSVLGEKPKQVRRRRNKAVLEIELELEDVPWAASFVNSEEKTKTESKIETESTTQNQLEKETEKETGKETERETQSNANNLTEDDKSESKLEAESLADSPDIAMVVMFLSRFHHLFPSTPLLSPQDLKHHLEQEGLSPTLDSLICCLMTYILNRKKPIETGKYRRPLEELTSLALSMGGIEGQQITNEIIPNNESALQAMSPENKLLFLRALVYWTLGASDVFKLLLSEIKQLPGYEVKKDERMAYEHLAVFPLGVDANRNRYFFIEGGEFDITTTRGQKNITVSTAAAKLLAVAGTTTPNLIKKDDENKDEDNNDEISNEETNGETDLTDEPHPAVADQNKPLHEQYPFLTQDPSLNKLTFLTDFQLYRERHRLTSHPEWVCVAHDSISLTKFLVEHASQGDDSSSSIKLRQKLQRLLPIIEQAEIKRQKAHLIHERKRALESAVQRAREGEGLYTGRTRRHKRVDYKEVNNPKQFQVDEDDDEDAADEDDGDEDDDNDDSFSGRRKRKANEDYIDEESTRKGDVSNSGRLRRSARVKYF